ncbi:MAG TPA: acyltransferase [Mycobacterium sp.]|nr:acyltransferase [Mycobacterium sp.]
MNSRDARWLDVQPPAAPTAQAGRALRPEDAGATSAPHEPVTGGRDRYFDVLRAVAVVRVVVYHMFPVAWLSMVFPAMGVMFALGGSLMARSMERSVEQAIIGRLRRLLPALWVMGAVLVPAMTWSGWPARPDWPSLLLWVLPVAEPPGTEWAEPITGVLWYVVTYLWLVLLSPAALWLYRRARLATIFLPLVLLAAMDWIPWFLSDVAGSVVTDVLTFAACWILGFAHRDGDLRHATAPALVAAGTIAIGGALAWVLTHPGGDGDIDLSSAPLAYGIYSIGFAVILLRFPFRVDRLTRRKLAVGLVNFVNARAVTIYLWHNAAITASFVVGDYLEVWKLGDSLMMAGYMSVATALLAITVALVGWVEDLSARRPLRLVPWRQAPASRPRPVKSDWAGPSPWW